MTLNNSDGYNEKIALQTHTHIVSGPASALDAGKKTIKYINNVGHTSSEQAWVLVWANTMQAIFNCHFVAWQKKN